MIVRLSAVLLPVLLGGCGGQADACDDLGVFSVQGTMVDESGNPLPGGTVTYVRDGGSPESCETSGDGSFQCGADVAGDFVLTASLTGHRDVEVAVTVEDGVCHVISRTVVFEMVAVDCTAEVVASVAVSLSTESGAPLTNPEVVYQIGGDEARMACTGNDTAWTCGEGLAGEFSIFASADGFAEQSAQTVVEMDEWGCHPVTMPVAIEFSGGG
jgi:hypothetical protein